MKPTPSFLAIALNAIVAVISYFCDVGLGWTAVTLLWLNMVLYACFRIRQRVFLLAFLIAFFVFLLGREMLMRYLDYEPLVLPPEVDAHLIDTLFLGLLGVWVGHLIADRCSSLLPSRRRDRAREAGGTSTRERGRTSRPSVVGVRSASVLLFWATIGPAYYFVLARAQTVLASGYADLYSAEYRTTEASGAMGFVNQLSLMNTAALCIYLATLPTFRNARGVIALWGGVLLLSLATGQRGTFITGGLFILCYAVVRQRLDPREGWMSRGKVTVLALATPLLISVLTLVEGLRKVGNEYDDPTRSQALDFLYNQGVSSSVITNGFLFQHKIPDQLYLTEFLHSGFAARLLDVSVLQGNSIARATEGASYAHSLGYVLLNQAYLSGRGTGSSFLAEAYQDLGYPGVFLVGLVYGVLLFWVGRIRPGVVWGNALRLLIVQDLFWAPRGSATGFLAGLLTPSALLAISSTFLFGLLLTSYLSSPRRSRSPLRALRPGRRTDEHRRSAALARAGNSPGG